MKTLDEVIDLMEGIEWEDWGRDALDYLKEYKKQKHIWKKLYLLAHRMFWGLEEEYPLDGKRIENDLFDAYSEGFEDEDA